MALFVATLASAAGANPNNRLAPEIAEDLVMRNSWHSPIPKCITTVFVHSMAVHHVRTDQSLIACRDDRGDWVLSKLVQDGPGGLIAVKRTLVRQDERKLNTEEGRQLDTLAGSRALYREHVRRTGIDQVGEVFHVMQIVSPEGDVVDRWTGKLHGKLGQVADMVLGSGG